MAIGDSTPSSIAPTDLSSSRENFQLLLRPVQLPSPPYLGRLLPHDGHDVLTLLRIIPTLSFLYMALFTRHKTRAQVSQRLFLIHLPPPSIKMTTISTLVRLAGRSESDLGRHFTYYIKVVGREYEANKRHRLCNSTK